MPRARRSLAACRAPADHSRLEIRLPTEDELWVSLDGYSCDEGTELYRVMEEISDEQEEYFINRPVAPPAGWKNNLGQLMPAAQSAGRASGMAA